MAKYTWDHIHLRTTNPEAMAQWFEQKLGAEVVRTMQQGKPRIDLKLGGANIFIAPVTGGDGVNPPPKTPGEANGAWNRPGVMQPAAASCCYQPMCPNAEGLAGHRRSNFQR